MNKNITIKTKRKIIIQRAEKYGKTTYNKQKIKEIGNSSNKK